MTSPARIPLGQRLTVRLCAWVAVLLVIIAIAILAIDSAMVKERELNELQSRSLILSRNLLARFASAMVAEQPELAHGLLGFVAEQSSILRALVLDTGGKVRFSSEPEQVGAVIAADSPGCSGCHTGDGERPHEVGELQQESGALRFRRVTTIRNEPACFGCHRDAGERLGILVLDFTTERMQQELWDHRKITGLTVTVTMLAVVLVVFLLMMRIVRQPLNHLLTATAQVEAGDLDVRLEPGRPDEVGQLRVAFNAMTQQLKKHTTGLESIIDRRTRELREMQVQLLRTNRLATMGEMASAVAHEVRTPLNALVLNLHMVKKHLRPGEGIEEAVVIEEEIRRIDGVIERFLSMARFPPAEIENIDLNQLVNTVVAIMEPEARRSRVKLTKILVEPAPTALHDQDRMRQVLLNLVLNSIQAMDGGTVTVRTSATTPQIVVEDDGPGVPREAQEKIFDPFFSTREEGTGLGLAIAARLLREHHGELRYVDNPRGAKFAITLPGGQEPT